MRVDVKETEVFKFAELSDRAKERALREYSEHGMYYDWWKFVEEDAKECFKLCGFDINKVYFSGFWSQGDGACFEGSWRARDVKPGGLKARAPQDEELRRIAAKLERLADEFPRAALTVKHVGSYSHEYATRFEVEFPDDVIEELPFDSPESHARRKVLADAEEELIEVARDAMRWTYQALETDYCYLTSEESVAEMSEANGWEYTEEGKLYH